MPGREEAARVDALGGLDRLQATLNFDKPVQTVPQVSSKRAAALKKFGISCVRDLLCHYPRRYLDMSSVAKIAHLPLGSYATTVARIHEIKSKTVRRKLTLLEFTLVDETGVLIATFFNQPWLTKNFHPHDVVSVSGKVEFEYGFLRLKNPVIDAFDPTSRPQGKIFEFYPASSEITQALFRRIMTSALHEVKGTYDPLPLYLRSRYRLCSRFEALRMIHQPTAMSEVEEAKRRLKYEELLLLELYLVDEHRKQIADQQGFIQDVSDDLLTSVQERLAFSLSADQQQAIADIRALMAAPEPMRHLLLGDVGTGKTIVSLFAVIIACSSGHQAAMIGPTEVLVWQYGASLGPLLNDAGISWEVLTSSTPQAKKEDIRQRLAAGSLQVVFGTHALLEDELQFKSCSFVCIDEQQRFGVDQRKKLLDKAPGADVLSMTATPIPRSLALMLYGDVTLSYLRRREGQQTRSTKVCHFSDQGIAYDALRAALARGEQAYVICPLIGLDVPAESEDQPDIHFASVERLLAEDAPAQNSLHAASEHARRLREQIVLQARVELLHGKMSSQEKAAIMDAFRAGEIDVLVSTTVVEVGVDVPNATVMIIEDADRFGLAQLHQLRGRVGRGSRPGEVYLISRSKSPQALDRLRAMERTEDGFELSEFDLLQRKEGDIFGVEQHGRPPLKLVNAIKDKAIIEAARADAEALLEGCEGTPEEREGLLREVARMRKENPS